MACIANATTEPEEHDEVVVTREMMRAGMTDLALSDGFFGGVSALTDRDLWAVYIAMRRLEPEDHVSGHREIDVDQK